MIFHDSSEAGLALHPHEMLSSLGPSPEDELQRRREGGGRTKKRGGKKKKEEIGFHNTLKA